MPWEKPPNRAGAGAAGEIVSAAAQRERWADPSALSHGCHGKDEEAVFAELCHVVEEAIAVYHKDGKPLPPATSGRDFANKMQNVA